MQRLVRGAVCGDWDVFPEPCVMELLIARGWVYVNGKKATMETTIKNGDTVEIRGKWEAIYRLHETQLEAVYD